ncbi:hypothetical protein [Streptomyces phaeochromogenes]|uniref:hypothetical protein n=1 Tax=Streptomyces phaeochromogenes TaxID=1923 RepID=UPI00386F2129|nr:hypothetical protein OG277_26050 [Streptomyces phaeochromogenes]
MSNEQPPRDDDQAVAPADSYQTGRTYSSAEISRRIKGRRRLQPTDNARALAEHLLAEVIQHERDTAARRAAAGDPNPYDLAPYEDVHGVTNEYEAARASEDPGALDQFLDNLAEDFHLDDVRALRTATTAVQAAMGRIALAAREKGMSPDAIAAETGYTASRITQFIREEKQRRAAGDQ